MITTVIHILLQSASLSFHEIATNSTKPFLNEKISSDVIAGASPLSIFQILLALLAPFAVLLISLHLKLGIATTIFVTVLRTIVQLLLLACVFLSIIFNFKSPFLVVSYLLFISFIAAYEVMNRQTRTYTGHYVDSLCAVLIGGGLVGIYGTIIVYNPTPWWNPQIMVSVCVCFTDY